MNLFSWFTARRTTTKSRNTTRLRLNELEARDVPAAALDLTNVGAQGAIGGAIFRQYNDHSAANKNNGQVDSFLRLDDGGRENGYNTDARPLQFDESRNFTSSIKVSDLPLVTINGVKYREVVLDVNEPAWQPLVSLDELRIYVSNNAKLRNYNDRNETLGGLTPVYDMDAKNDRFVRIDASLNHRTGTGDIVVDIPDSVLTVKGSPYLALYSKFGVHNGAGGQFEEWGPGFGPTQAPTTQPPATQPPVAQPPATQVSITGFVLLDSGAGALPPWADSTVTLTGSNGVTQTVAVPASVNGASCTFQFSNIDPTVTYTLVAHSDLAGASSQPLVINPGDLSTGVSLTMVITE